MVRVIQEIQNGKRDLLVFLMPGIALIYAKV